MDVCEFVDRILRLAVERGASDQYWIPRKDGLDVRMRVDGVQESLEAVEPDIGRQCVARLKVLAGLLTYQTTVSQDGAIRGHDALGGAECRMSVMPSQFGERVSLRFLRGSAGPERLDGLGLEPSVTAALRRMLALPNGMIVLTGPTGCGKTTTIYAMVRELLEAGGDPASVISIEDPVEQVIPGITQASVREDWHYAAALKAALRQDVKTLIVGEMRDAEVVRVALDASLSGHRVITTYHAGDVPSVYARMIHQGFEPFLVASAITGVLGQRLFRGPNGAVPVAVVLEPDDAWRDTVCNQSGLEALRNALAGHAGADFAAAGERLVEAGRLTAAQAETL